MKRNYSIVILIMYTFFVISFLTNILGPLIPDIIDSFGLSLAMATCSMAINPLLKVVGGEEHFAFNY